MVPTTFDTKPLFGKSFENSRPRRPHNKIFSSLCKESRDMPWCMTNQYSAHPSSRTPHCTRRDKRSYTGLYFYCKKLIIRMQPGVAMTGFNGWSSSHSFPVTEHKSTGDVDEPSRFGWLKTLRAQNPLKSRRPSSWLLMRLGPGRTGGGALYSLVG